MSLEVFQIPVLRDNYIYVLRDDDVTAVVDPAEAEPVIRYLDQLGNGLDYILNTHHHGDHVGGNLRLKQRYECQIVGPKADSARIPGIDIALGDGDEFMLGGSRAVVFDTPGHTRGHIAYYFAKAAALFCGDTLFSIGCGRLFEGTPEQMWTSLQKLRRLPDETSVYCAHEYTESNLRFALSLEPTHEALRAYADKVRVLRSADEPSVPSKLADEKQCNPFLRADDPALARVVGETDAARVFAEIRHRKDSF